MSGVRHTMTISNPEPTTRTLLEAEVRTLLVGALVLHAGRAQTEDSEAALAHIEVCERVARLLGVTP